MYLEVLGLAFHESCESYMGTNQGAYGYKSRSIWVQIKEYMGTNQGVYGYKGLYRRIPLRGI